MSDSSRDGPSLLVVGYDGSTSSRKALAYAAGMARRERSELVVVEVNPSGPDGTSAVDPSAGSRAGRASRAGSLTTEVAFELEELLPGRWWVELCQGDPATELQRLSNDLQSDAIVIGRARGSVRHSVSAIAKSLIRHAHQPVIVVP